MSEILIFGGTTEGRLLAEFCAENEIFADISVTTDYGAEILPKSKYINIMTGRRNKEEITKILKKHQYTAVIDATHPYAQEISKNVKSACTNIKYIRLIRQSSELSGLIFDNLSEIIELCNKSSGNILSTLGSKECHEITKINDFQERVWLRILPFNSEIQRCTEVGFPLSHIITSGKPPYSTEWNINHIRLCNAKFLITKESGATGGYPEKVKAAEICKIQLITLKRPQDNDGLPIDEVKKLLLNERIV
ncbi:MAG TPA: precorrin-6A reductase [Ruminococcus sp.]|nr:precorrin-6A reductase [Ruminococcus sp.]